MAADLYEPGGTGFGGALSASRGAPDSGREPAGLRRGLDERRSKSTSGKIALRATRMPLPIAVARCSCRRSIAATRSSRFCVGGCTSDAVPANATMPTRVLRGCSLMNVFAATCAAVMRSGSTSFARMLPETSRERMMVSCCEGRRTTAAGRATAAIITISATRKSSGGTWRRRRCAAPMASLTMVRLA
jgi:hypothetical protein